MTKSFTISALFAAFVLLASFAVVSPAFAAVDFQGAGFKVNGNTNDTIQPGDDYEVTVNLDITGDTEVEYFRVRLYEPGDSGPNSWVSSDCQAVGRIRALNDENVRFNTETPSDIPNGPYDIQLEAYGIDGEAQSNGCDPVNDIDQETYGNRLFVDNDEDVVGDSNDTSDGDTVVGGINLTSLLASINALTKAFEAYKATQPATPTTPNKPAFCASMPVYAVYNRVAVQTWLFNNGFTGPFYAVGITNAAQFSGPNIVWGTASNAAYTQALAQCN